MTIFNPTNIIFNGKEPNYMVLNGKIIWQKEKNPYRVEYTVNPFSDSDTVDTQVSGIDLYLPNSNYTKIEIVLNDDTVVTDTSLQLKDVKRIIAYYKANTTSLDFLSASNNNPKRIKTVEYFNISNFTDLSSTFLNCKYLERINCRLENDGIVTKMKRMFFGCESLQSVNLDGINTTNVTDMSHMFYKCKALNSVNISTLDTSSVTNMHSMFYDCSSLTSLDLSNWNVSSVTDMSYMFNCCSGLTSLNLSNWNTNNVSHTIDMFSKVSTTVDWHYDEKDVNSYTNFTLTERQTSFTLNNNGVNIKKFPWNLTEYCLEYTIEPDENVPLFNAQILEGYYNYYYLPTTTTDGIIYEKKYETIEITLRDGSVVYEIDNVLAKDVKKVKIYYTRDTKGIKFSGYVIWDYVDNHIIFLGEKSNNLKELISINTRNFTTYSSMFKACTKLTSLDLSSWNTSNITNMGSMFESCTNLMELNLSTWNTKNVNESEGMFRNIYENLNWCHNEKDPNSYANFTLSESSTNYIGEFPWNTNVLYLRYENVPSGFSYYGLLPYIDDDETTLWNNNILYNNNGSYFPIDKAMTTSKLGNVELKIRYSKNDTNIIGMNFKDITNYITEVENMYIASHWNILRFKGCSKLKKLSLYGDTRGITDMCDMFYECSNLIEINGISEFNTSNVTSLWNTFYRCRSLKSLDLSKWNVSKCEDMNSMFNQCESLELLNLSTWDTNHIDIENDYDKIWAMFDSMPTTVDWCYDESDPNSYANFTLDEDITFYDGTFPWNKD